MNKTNSIIVEEVNSLWDSLLSQQDMKQNLYFERSSSMCDQQEERLTLTEAQSFLDPKVDDEISVTQMSRMSSSDQEDELCFCKDKNNVIETKQCYVQEMECSFINPTKIESLDDMCEEEQVQKVPQLLKSKKAGEFKSILKQRKIKGEWKKNTNVPKFLARIYMKYFQDFTTQTSNEALMNHYRLIKKELCSRPSNNFSIADVISLLRLKDNQLVNLENRKIMANIIKETLQGEVAENRYIKNNHMSYMLAIKLYNIRCRSQALTERVKLF